MTRKPFAMPAWRRALAAALLALPAALPAHEYYTDSFQIVHPWAHPAPAGTRTARIYMRIVDISADDRLLSASSEIAGRVELRAAAAGAPAGIGLARGRELSLSAGGAHLLLHGLKTELHEGRQYPLRLVFENSGEVRVDFIVGAH